MIEDPDFVTAQTDDIVISACPMLLEEDKAGREFLWGYYMRIENNSGDKIHLLGKNWNITDERGNSFCDDSAGFKGEIPELEPGEYFEFSSMTPVNSPNAVFYGSCKIMDEKKRVVKEVRIPTFALSARPEPSSAVLN